MFIASDSFQSFIDFCWARACLETGFTSESQCQEVLIGRRVGETPLMEGLETLSDDETLTSTDLLTWFAFNVLGDLSPELRVIIITALAERDPATCCVIYQDRADLTAEEDSILLAAFKDTMPFMAKKFEADPGLRSKGRLTRG